MVGECRSERKTAGSKYPVGRRRRGSFLVLFSRTVSSPPIRSRSSSYSGAAFLSLSLSPASDRCRNREWVKIKEIKEGGEGNGGLHE